jgi:hypothetical protein
MWTHVIDPVEYPMDVLSEEFIQNSTISEVARACVSAIILQ